MHTSKHPVRRPLALAVIFILLTGVGMTGAAAVPGSDASAPDLHSAELPDGAVGPSHSLYGLKLSLESLDESFAMTPQDRIERQVEHAGNRIAEAKAGLDMNRISEATTALEEYNNKMDATAAVAAALPMQQTPLSDAQARIQDHQAELEGLMAGYREEAVIRNAYTKCLEVNNLISSVAASPTPVPLVTIPIIPDRTPTPAPTITMKPSPTVTPSPTKTASPTPTPTPTTQITPSPTPTPTPTQTQTPVPTTSPVHTAPVVSGMVTGNVIPLSWNLITDPDLMGYKVVVSKNRPNPRYPDDGYMYYITDRYHNYAILDTSTPYNGGDIGGSLQPGQTYHISVTALYPDTAVPGNAITLTFPIPPATTATTAAPTPTPTASPQPTHTVPSATAQAAGTAVVMNWQKIPDTDLIGYKVVISKNKDNPVYPADGYMFWITNRDTTSATITATNSYNGGDIGGTLQPGTSYAFSITAIYQPWTPVAGNAVRLTFPESPTPTPTTPPTTTPVTTTTTMTPSAASPAAGSIGYDTPSVNPLLQNEGVSAVM